MTIAVCYTALIIVLTPG